MQERKWRGCEASEIPQVQRLRSSKGTSPNRMREAIEKLESEMKRDGVEGVVVSHRPEDCDERGRKKEL